MRGGWQVGGAVGAWATEKESMGLRLQLAVNFRSPQGRDGVGGGGAMWMGSRQWIIWLVRH